MAALFGRPVDEVKSSLTQRAYLDWQLYWEHEPWGPWRDNMHAAIIAKEIRRGLVRSGTRIKLDTFMIRKPEERLAEANTGLLGLLRAVATPVKRAQ